MSCSNPNHHWMRDASLLRPGCLGAESGSGDPGDGAMPMLRPTDGQPRSVNARKLLLQARIAVLLCDRALASCVAGQVEAQAAARARRVGPRWSSSWDGADPPFRRLDAPVSEG